MIMLMKLKQLMTAAAVAVVIGMMPAFASAGTPGAPEQELLELSQAKWDWMSQKNVEALDSLFHPTAQFVHMGGYWGKPEELNTIRSGAIWYKKAEVHDVKVFFTEHTATVYSTIHLNSEVGGNSVRFPFFVTEVYVKEGGRWQLTSLVFTKTLGE